MTNEELLRSTGIRTITGWALFLLALFMQTRMPQTRTYLAGAAGALFAENIWILGRGLLRRRWGVAP